MTTYGFSESSASRGFKLAPRCHESHKDIQFGDGVILGASCGSPRDGYDIYIGFDWGMTFNHQGWPWENSDNGVIEFQYLITDMCAPKSPKDFKNLVKYCVEQLRLGKKIHMGCIGGHGRTGLVIAAIKYAWDGTEDATAWTRKHHCAKAVESKSQVKFLHKHFGIKKVAPAKHSWKDIPTGRIDPEPSSKVTSIRTLKRPHTEEKIAHVGKRGSIWG